jgi:hypothetical protein
MGTITRSFANNITSGGTFDATDLTGTIPASNIADASVGNITAVPALTSVSTVASDPPSPDAGQVWYNTTDKALRAYVLGAGTWATGGALNTGRQQGSPSSAGTQTASLYVGGTSPTTGATELYDGTSWTEIADLNTARYLMPGAGTTTSALVFGGSTSTPANPGTGALNESFNGTSWTELADLNLIRRRSGGCGASNTSALTFGGTNTPGTFTANTETWNGSSWTEVNNLNSAKDQVGSAGIVTAALCVGGYNPVALANTESWNGTSWTEVADLNTARSGLGCAGTQTSALAFGGATPDKANTEEWNGASWTETSDLSTARSGLVGSGTTAAALAFGGSPNLAATEEWTVANVTTDLGVS